LLPQLNRRRARLYVCLQHTVVREHRDVVAISREHGGGIARRECPAGDYPDEPRSERRGETGEYQGKKGIDAEYDGEHVARFLLRRRTAAGEYRAAAFLHGSESESGD